METLDPSLNNHTVMLVANAQLIILKSQYNATLAYVTH